MDEPSRPDVELRIAGDVIAELAARAASKAPGVARLHRHVIDAARRALHAAVLRRGGARGSATPIRGAVEVIDEASEPLVVTVPIVASGAVTVIDTVAEVQRRVGDELRRQLGRTAVVTVAVLDIRLADSAP